MPQTNHLQFEVIVQAYMLSVQLRSHADFWKLNYLFFER